MHLKTDSPNLFEFTMAVIKLFDLTLVKQSEDIYGEQNIDPRCAIKTYYEGLNIAGSNRIHYIEFKIDKDNVCRHCHNSSLFPCGKLM